MMNPILQLLLISLACLAVSAQNTEKTYTLQVTEDVTLESATVNYNYLPYLIVGTHPQFPLKRSLMKFQNIPSECTLPLEATLHIYFLYAHKASYMSETQVPAVTRHITAHTVLKSWSESQATSKKRNNWSDWQQRWLGLGSDAASLSLYSTTIPPTPGNKWYTLDVTVQAQDWKFGSNYGLLLRDTHEQIEGRDFRFASNAYGDSSKHAYITVKCSVQQQSTGGGGGGIISPIGGGNNPI